jgi:hypothetical protein
LAAAGASPTLDGTKRHRARPHGVTNEIRVVNAL